MSKMRTDGFPTVINFTLDLADITCGNINPDADNTYDIGGSGLEFKDLYIDGTANIDSLVADTANIDGGTLAAVTTDGALNVGKGQSVYRVMKNNDADAMAAGDVVILDTSDNTGQSVCHTTTEHAPLVFGVVTTGGAAAADVTVCVSGYYDGTKVDGTDDIAVGDPLSTFTGEGIGQKGTWAGGGIYAIALEAYTTDDSNGTIKSWIL